VRETWADPAAAFRVRAREEADRYGGDPWVLVRELLQNARDAGARTVRIEALNDGGVDRLTVRDDGEGLDLASARRFLLTLYASNKGRRDQAGRFGVGFWSVLRFEPERIVVRSWPRRGVPWELAFDGRLHPERAGEPAPGPPGFEVVLERPARGEDVPRRVSEAVGRDAPYLRRRGEPDAPVEVTVNGQATTTPFGLPAPSLRFRRPGMRGAVGLGSEPRVDLYAHGLRVRSAASLDDLLVTGGGHVRKAATRAVGKGLAPTVLLDSDRIELLLARGDARDTRELHRLVDVARRELDRLVRGQLDRWAPRPWPLRLLDRIPRPRLRGRWWAAAGVLAAVALAFMAGVGLPWRRSGGGSSALPPVAAPVPYEDLGQAYGGPTVEGLGNPPAVNLTYRPAGQTLLIAALVLDGLEADGRPRAGGRGVAPYPRHACAASCVEFEVMFVASSRWLRLPVPTGHRLEASSVTVDGTPVRTWASPTGEAMVELPEPRTGTVRYRTGPGPAWPASRGGWPALPPPLARAAESLRALPAADRVGAALELVRSRVRYDATPAAATRHREAARHGLSYVHRALMVGAGDCDVQNGVLAAVLDAAGVGARLAVGFLGEGGRAAAGLHAWLEVVVDGRLLVVDASATGAGVGMATAAADVREADPGAPPPRVGPLARAVPAGWGLVVVLAATAAVAVAVGALVRRGRRRLQLAAGDGLAELLRGALEHPEAFARVAEVQTRPLVPVVGGGRVSLARARRLEGRALYCGGPGERLAEEASGCGAVVVDAATPGGRVVADAFGAVDLDWWQRVLEHSEPLSIEVRLGKLSTQVRLAEGVGEPLRSLEVHRLGLDLVVVDRASPLGRRLVELVPGRPAQAALLIVDAAVRQRGLPAAHRGRLLRVAARAALAEEGAA